MESLGVIFAMPLPITASRPSVERPRSAASAAGPMRRSFRESLRSGWRPTRSAVSGSAGLRKRPRMVVR